MRKRSRFRVSRSKDVRDFVFRDRKMLVYQDKGGSMLVYEIDKNTPANIFFYEQTSYYMGLKTIHKFVFQICQYLKSGRLIKLKSYLSCFQPGCYHKYQQKKSLNECKIRFLGSVEAFINKTLAITPYIFFMIVKPNKRFEDVTGIDFLLSRLCLDFLPVFIYLIQIKNAANVGKKYN